jgi:predicted glycosyltransferase
MSNELLHTKAIRDDPHSLLVTHPLVTAKQVWIDLENSPHVPFFVPIILELERAGCEVILTARDFAQTRELVERAGLNARIIGGEWGNNTTIKTFGLLQRALRLAWMMRGRKISLAVGHGSRGLLLAARMLRIPVLELYDYEGASVRLFNRLSNFVMTPEAIPFSTLEKLGLTKQKHLTYPGLKEDVYASAFQPNENIVSELGLDPSRITITIRPPSRTAHYRSEESFRLFDGIMKLIGNREDVQIVMLPRERKHSSDHPPTPSFLRRGSQNIIVPSKAVDGMNLLYHSDLVISGGGTMNREAAALGIPTVTIFKGLMGAVDQWLIDSGKMIAIDNAEEIVPMLRKRQHIPMIHATKTKDNIVGTILHLCGLH